MFYTSRQIKDLTALINTPNPDAPPFEPDTWNDGSFESLKKALAQFPGIFLAIRNELKPWLISFLVKDVLQQNDQTLAQKFNIRAERFRDFKEVLQPILTNVTFSTNCYDYAANCKRVMPGALGYPGAQIPDAKTPLSTFKLVENTENDGFVRLNPSAGLPPKHYLCLLFQSAEDFHYVRQDNCGFSHKVGHNCCTNQDANRQVISNPLNAAYTNGVKFISAFAVPSGGIETRGFEI